MPSNTKFEHGAYWAGVASVPMMPLIIAAVIFPGLISKAFVLSKLWSWYAVPIGAPPLSIAAAFGFSLIVALLVARSPTKPDPERDLSLRKRILFAVIGPFAVLPIGWIGTFFL